MGICSICGKETDRIIKGACSACYRRELWVRKLIKCKNCGRMRPHKAFGLCNSCHVKLYHYDSTRRYNCRKWHNISLELYKKVTKKCLICGFSKVVELHHLDHNKDNNSAENLIGLCPNHHKLLHHGKYQYEVIEPLVEMGFKIPVKVKIEVRNVLR